MDYYVVAHDDQKYGPADLYTLSEWRKQGRIAPNTVLEALDGTRVVASSVLPDPAAGQPQQPFSPPHGQAPGTHYAPYQRPQGPQYSNVPYNVPRGPINGQTEGVLAWVFLGISVFGCLCCFPIVFSIPAAILGRIAWVKGYPSGQIAMILSIVVGVLQILFLLFSYSNPRF